MIAGGERTVEAIAEAASGGGWIIRSPRVGILRGLPRPGGRRAAGEAIGQITVLERAEPLLLPPGVEGLVSDLRITDRMAAVEYGQELFWLAPVAEAIATTAGGAQGIQPGTAVSMDRGLPEGCHAVVSPIDGIFYRRSAPGASPYVEEGATIETGRTIGLIEAMKSFNAVLYGGPGLPARAVVAEARAADASEVRQGAILFVVRSA